MVIITHKPNHNYLVVHYLNTKTNHFIVLSFFYVRKEAFHNLHNYIVSPERGLKNIFFENISANGGGGALTPRFFKHLHFLNVTGKQEKEIIVNILF